ncbi:Nitrogen regulatory protein PII [Halobacillus karajensis]|uniref:Nitrogen regulatory protein P-II n=1 Tax=Halobacillus karajensis TaxID=195088 RepID=A0A024P4M4_9BACI|nr:P-II family nitrogen regulator [Halobacillus karajensis]CDQ20837.1 Nitrogen regulatory protein P-II [Halobacillus karajensis]CDQ23693.1 Nitrogen regulatory protein P-II [Halobacillus karajensis]CDQ27171.1 Nitrogen regulatory protein P-II [Halobacillus karajensis]SEI03849.1 Nitrogen regulatory protein PII [Halobacillus karajensis]
MSSKTDRVELELVCVIVNVGLGSKIMKSAKKHGISGGTVLVGRGTVKSRVLGMFGVTNVKKEIILMGSNKLTASQVLEKLNEKFKFNKPNHGIAFTTSVNQIFGASSFKSDRLIGGGGADNKMYHAITVIIEKGNAEEVIDAATEAGSKGGTIINARGSGIHETSKVFSMDIEPEKEIVLILSEQDSTDAIVSSIRRKLKIDEPGNGIIFIQDINSTYGLYK